MHESGYLEAAPFDCWTIRGQYKQVDGAALLTERLWFSERTTQPRDKIIMR